MGAPTNSCWYTVYDASAVQHDNHDNHINQKIAQSQQTQNIFRSFVQRRLHVFDAGPTLYKCYTKVLCWLRCPMFAKTCHNSVMQLMNNQFTQVDLNAS